MAELLAHLYPGAQFICLYRHCLDVVVSAIEAAPWGLSGYGFDAYVADTPANSVLAAARAWLDQTKAIIEFQESHPDRCHGIRYEDLVTGPEQITATLFTFLGLAPVPGITETCFSQEHDVRGAGDHKIWFTSRISADSLGQGARVPVRMLSPEVLKSLNETLDQLGYRQVDEDWMAARDPADPRADVTGDAVPGQPADTALDAAAGQIAARLGSVPEERLRDLARLWPAAADGSLVIAVRSSNDPLPGHCWTVSREDSALSVCEGQSSGQPAVTVLAAPVTWQALLEGTANVGTEVRAGRLQLQGAVARPQANEAIGLTAEIRLIAHLLGLHGGSRSPEEHQEANAPVFAGRHG
jgi:sulfotransferase family protein